LYKLHKKGKLYLDLYNVIAVMLFPSEKCKEVYRHARHY